MELKFCPFCGCTCEVTKKGNYSYKIVGDHDDECIFFDMLWGDCFDDETKLVELWNRRIFDDKNF